MKRGDLILISILVVVALAFLVPRWLPERSSEINHNKNVMTATIKVDGKLFRTVTLTQEEQTIEIRTNHGFNLLKIHDYGIEMVDADCPDEVCLGFGFVTKKGQSIVCLPHRVIVEINGTDDTGGDEVDAVV